MSNQEFGLITTYKVIRCDLIAISVGLAELTNRVEHEGKIWWVYRTVGIISLRPHAILLVSL